MASRFCRGLAVVVVLLAICAPGFAQQEKGDKEIAANGSLDIPNSDPGSAQGTVQARLGDYFTTNNLVGVNLLAIIAKSDQSVFFDPFVRHLFSTKNPKLYPFVGANAGVSITHDGGTGTQFLAVGEAGIKYYMSRRFAFEIAYNLQYVRVAGAGFANSTDSVVTFGFSYLFGGRRH